MFKRYAQILLIIIILGGVSGCSLAKQSDGGTSKGNSEVVEKPPKDQQTPEKTEPVDPIKEQIKKMTLEEKIGQMFMVGIDGYTIDDNTKNLLENYKVGGIILFGNNVQDSNQLLQLLNSLKEENLTNDVPLFLSVDEEGGRVSRMPKELIKLPTAKAVGNINNKEFSYKIGSVIAEEIKSFGFNMDFAPVLDVNSNPNNPVIGDRAFGREPSIVASLGIETMKGIQSQKVIPVAKHFPGHGDTSVDSHIGLPVVNKDLSSLESFELIPFKEGIKNKAEAIMIAHILLPQIDKDNPASLSKTIITDVLRKKLNFQGVVITDDMTMGAILENYNISDAAVKSIKAGSDIVLVCHGYEREIEAINAVKAAVESGEISQDRIDESAYRVLSLKKKYNLKDEAVSSINVNEINNKINELLNNYLR